MELDLLRTFVLLAKLGHMTRASQQLHLTQPAVSAQLRRLEESVGRPLFDRHPKGLVLTEAGSVLLVYAREALDCVARGRVALDELEGLARGALSIGGGATATTYLLPPLLGRFHEAHPGIHIFVREQGSARTIASVEQGALDLGIVTLVGGAGRVGRGVAVEAWVEDELQLIVPPGHRLEGGSEFEWSDLSDQPLVLFEAGTAVRALLDARFEAAGVRPRIVMELRSIESIKQMVAQGIGAAFVSRHALSKANQKGLTSNTGPIKRQLALVHRRDRTMGRAAQAFFELMKGSLSPQGVPG